MYLLSRASWSGILFRIFSFYHKYSTLTLWYKHRFRQHLIKDWDTKKLRYQARKSGQEVKVWILEVGTEVDTLEKYWLLNCFPHSFVCLCSYTTQDHLSRSGTANSGVGRCSLELSSLEERHAQNASSSLPLPSHSLSILIPDMEDFSVWLTICYSASQTIAVC